MPTPWLTLFKLLSGATCTEFPWHPGGVTSMVLRRGVAVRWAVPTPWDGAWSPDLPVPWLCVEL